MSEKWVSCQALTICLDPEKQPSSTARRLSSPVRVGGIATISRLPAGTQEGRSVALIQVDLDDGTTLVLETSLRLLDSAVTAFKTRDEMEGRPC